VDILAVFSRRPEFENLLATPPPGKASVDKQASGDCRACERFSWLLGSE